MHQAHDLSDSGKPTPAAISHIKINNTTTEQRTEIANIIASTIVYQIIGLTAFIKSCLYKKSRKLNSTQIAWNHIIYMFLWLS